MSDPRERSRPIIFIACPVVACLVFCGLASAAPSITLSKKSGPPKSKILVSGRGFEPNVVVDIFFDTEDEALVVTNNEGEFHNAGIYAPHSAHPGKHWVTALERTIKKTTGAQDPFVVNTNWPELNYSPDHEGLNPYENVVNRSDVNNLTLRWTFSNPPSNLFSNPAVVDGVLYSGSIDSNLYALDARTGALVWKRTIPSYQFSPPAVSNGVVYVGSCDKNLYAVDAKTGNVLWTYTTGACVFTSPAVVNGVVYVGSDSLYALDAATGTLLWKYASAFYILSSPAVANGVVCFGSGSYGTGGTVYALNANTGALLWSFSTQYDVEPSPAISDGAVYVAERNGPFFALNLVTGSVLWDNLSTLCCSSAAVAYGKVYVSDFDVVWALGGSTGWGLWSYMMGRGANDPVVANGVVYVGSADNNIHGFDARTGALLWQYTLDNGGLDFLDAIVVNGFVYTVGEQISAFSLPDDDPAWAPAQRPDLATLNPNLQLRPR